jgi:hypothetical protein
VAQTLKKSALTDENSAFENDLPPDAPPRRFSALPQALFFKKRVDVLFSDRIRGTG